MRSLENQIALCARAQWLLGGVMVMAVVAFYLLVYRPATVRLHDMQQQVAGRRQELLANQSRASSLPILAQEVARLQERLEGFDKRIPAYPDLGQFIHDINQLSQQASLKRLTVQPGTSRRSDLYSELPVCISFEGDFIGVASFLRQVEELQQLTRVRTLSIKGKDSKFGRVEVDMAVDIYFAEG